MRIRLSRSITTKVTDDQYAKLQVLAGDRTLSEWARDILLAATRSRSVDEVIVAELMALRTILLNLHYAVATGQVMTPETMQRLIDRADQDKVQKAHERLASAAGRCAR